MIYKILKKDGKFNMKKLLGIIATFNFANRPDTTID